MTLRWLHIRHLIDEQESTPKRKPLLSIASSLVLVAALSGQLAFLTDINTCPQTFDEFFPLQGQCYSLHYEFLTWSEAQKFCNVNTGRLIEIYSETELNYLKMNFMNLPKNDVPSSTWLGAVSNGKNNIFKWDSTKNEPTFDPAWAKGFPKHYSKVNSCASWLIQFNHTWINHDCEERMPFICKMSVRGYKEGTHEKSNSNSKKPETADPDARVRILGQEIFQSSIMDKREFDAQFDHLSWYDALSLCESFNMTLLENHGIDLDARLQEENIWLGAIRYSYANSQYEFQWLNGRKENLTGKVFHVNEETRVDKCLFANLQFGTRGLPLLHMTDCNETAFFRRTVCVKVRERYNCRLDSDCHRSASCIHGKCLCNVGYEGNGHLCFDVNECKKYDTDVYTTIDTDICVSRKVGPCSNLIGSFTCRGCNPFHHEETSKCPYDPCDLIDCDAKEGKVLERIANKCRCRCMEGFINYGGYCFQIIHAEGHSGLVILRLAREWEFGSSICRLPSNYSDLFDGKQMGTGRTFTLCKVWLRNEKNNSKCTRANFNDVIGCGGVWQSMVICKQQFDGMFMQPCNVDSDCSTIATCNKTANYNGDKTGICACNGGFYGHGHTCNACTTINHSCPKDECDCFGPNWPMMRPCH